MKRWTLAIALIALMIAVHGSGTEARSTDLGLEVRAADGIPVSPAVQQADRASTLEACPWLKREHRRAAEAHPCPGVRSAEPSRSSPAGECPALTGECPYTGEGASGERDSRIREADRLRI